MIQNLYALIIQSQMEESSNWFVRNLDKLLSDIQGKQILDVLMNPYVLVLTVILVGMGIIVKNKKFIMIVIACWGYGVVYHFTIATKTAGDVGFDEKVGTTSNMGSLVIFFLGFTIVSAVLLYWGFLKGD